MLGPAAQRMTAGTALSVLERAAVPAAASKPEIHAAAAGAPTPAARLAATATTTAATAATAAAAASLHLPSVHRDGVPLVDGAMVPAPAPAALIRAHLMSGSGPSAFAGVQELLDALRRAPAEQVLVTTRALLVN